MKFTMNGTARRGILATFASGMALVASLAVLPSTPALALTNKCSGTFGTTVKFKVCVYQTGSTSAQAHVEVTGGSSYISGTLYLLAPDDLAHDAGCSGKHYSGYKCSGPSLALGHGVYEAEWASAGGGTYYSPGLTL